MECFVSGLPVAQGSKRHVGKGRMIESAKGLEPWREVVAWEAKRAAHGRKFTGPIQAHFVFWFPRPKSHYGTGSRATTLKDLSPIYHTIKPDLDKLVRAVGDALTTSGVITDDSLIAKVAAEKRYGPPGVHITLSELAF